MTKREYKKIINEIDDIRVKVYSGLSLEKTEDRLFKLRMMIIEIEQNDR